MMPSKSRSSKSKRPSDRANRRSPLARLRDRLGRRPARTEPRLPGDRPAPRRSENANPPNQHVEERLDGSVDGRAVDRGGEPFGVGDRGVVRVLLSVEVDAFLAHLRRLDPDARRRRFSRNVGDRELTRFVAAIDWSRTLIAGYFENGVLRGAAQLAWPDVPWLGGAAELAVEVEAGWRRRGIARALMRRAAGEASARSLPGILFFAQSDNEPMLALARGLETPLKFVGSDVEGWIRIGPPPRPPARFYGGRAV